MASSQPFPAMRARFGRYELDLNSRELFCSGIRLPIQDKPFQILRLLLEAEGQAVSREQIRAALWPDDTFVDFEHGVNTAVKKLRQALDDSAENPRFIETLPRVGYRFLVPVEWEESTPLGKSSGVVTMPSPAPLPGPHEPGPHLVVPPRQGKMLWMLPVAAAAVVVLAGGLWYLNRPLPPPSITGYTQLTHDGQPKFPAATDGTRLYYTQVSPRSIKEVGVNGGEAAQVPLAVRGSKLWLSDVSADGSTALVISYDTEPFSLLATPMLGGAIQHVANGEKGVFSPDGRSLIYCTESGDITLARRDGSEPRKVANSPGAGSFRWSPDGRVIRFANGHTLWEMSSDGSGLHRLLPDWPQHSPCCGRWTPDGHFFLFVLFNTDSNGSQIWALDERRRLFLRVRTQPIQLTVGPGIWWSLVPSADGKRIFASGSTPRGELSRIDLKTGGLQPFLGGISAEYLSFSADGKSIAYVTFPDGILWAADRDGSHRVQLTEMPDRAAVPHWSPDSKQIAFTVFNTEGRSLGYVVSTDGRKPKRILPDEREDQTDPRWSPDGTKILYARGNRSTKEGEDLRILDLASRQVQVVPGSKGKWAHSWSADGRYIAALDHNAQSALQIFDSKAQRWSSLSTETDGQYLNFSRDNRFIYFLRYGAVQGVYRIPVTGGKVEQVVDMKDWHLTGQFMASMTLDPTDSPLVLREVGGNDIYALSFQE
jgi:Tol biopolymer transport system component/DNA-binding winged helix-turn-helix (wHTH) protein